MEKFIQTIELLEREPAKWLAQKTTVQLEMFMAGFCSAETLGNENLQLLTPLLNGFAQFLATKYSSKFVDYDQSIALQEAGYDDDESFELYFREWREFYSAWAQNSGIAPLKAVARSVVDVSAVIGPIRARPGAYLRGPLLGSVYSFVSGIRRSCECYVPGAKVVPDFSAFEVWLAERAPLKRRCRWDRILVAEHAFNERAALDGFFLVLEEFQHSQES